MVLLPPARQASWGVPVSSCGYTKERDKKNDGHHYGWDSRWRRLNPYCYDTTVALTASVASASVASASVTPAGRGQEEKKENKCSNDPHAGEKTQGHVAWVSPIRKSKRRNPSPENGH